MGKVLSPLNHQEDVEASKAETEEDAEATSASEAASEVATVEASEVATVEASEVATVEVMTAGDSVEVRTDKIISETEVVSEEVTVVASEAIDSEGVTGVASEATEVALEGMTEEDTAEISDCIIKNSTLRNLK